ncbi:MAG: diguanylate cyclase [Aestuariibacter sp.]
MLKQKLVKGRNPFWLSLLVLAIGIYLVTQLIQLGRSELPYQHISRTVQTLPQQSPQTSIQQVVQLQDNQWLTIQAEQLTLQGDGQQPAWVKFRLPSMDQFEHWLLEVNNPQLDSLEVWFFDERGLLSEYQTGDQFPFRSRVVDHERFLFPVPTTQDSAITVYLKVRHQGSFQLPIGLWNQRDFLVFNGEHSMVMGIFLGFMLAMTLSNFFFFVFSRSLNFLLYCGYALSVALLLISLHGLSFKYFWPESVWLQNHGIGFFSNATLMFAVLFIRQLVNLKPGFPFLDLLLRCVGGLFALAMMVSLFFDVATIKSAFLSFVILLVLSMLVTGIWLASKGLKVSSLYVAAWLVLLFSALSASLEGLQVLQLPIPTAYFLMVGAAIETMLLALLLAQNSTQQAKDLLSAREKALKQEQQIRAAKEQAIELQERINEELEYKVQERTLELEVTLRELAEKNRELEEKNTTDALTGARNRRYFDKRYIAEVRRSRREQTPLSVAMVDIDHFKQVNDNFGHLIGDECIKQIALTLMTFLKRPSDEVFRYGGEEFAIIMPATELDGAYELLEKIRLEIASNAIEHDGGELSVTISVGIATQIITADMADNDLLDEADKALYQAKEQGRNRCVSQQPEPQQEMQHVQ